MTLTLARYIVEDLININTSSMLVMDDVFDLASNNPILLALDGLDEVPNLEIRRQIVENLRVFLRCIDSENGDVQVILSSRPKGYSGEFEGFKPIKWELNELEKSDFDEYCDCWLKKRIPDTEERSEAKERINRGMLSESVQRLARSLLQATVILTIVRRKIEIPHQRNSLYKKYVEVIFDREKEKSSMVREHESALLRHHERVGYELHCKMEQSRVEALDRSTFRSYVLSVLEDYSAIEFKNKKLGEVANEIIEAATDRLCLLVGKGENQTDVDFVVQQYREYFAAVYLFNHPDADPDRVFDMLVQRGAYWVYVLQFYVAQANTNQQMRWVTGISEQNDGEAPVEALIRRTRIYRAILNVLPEFTLQRRSDFERAIKILFSFETRWTWLEQETAIGILKLSS
jgi:predicted NACHT family NTPase